MAICRMCDAELPTVRMPTSLRQAMWGGWDCPSCGAVLDGKGRPLAERSDLADRTVFRMGAPPSAGWGVAILASLFAMIGCTGASPLAGASVAMLFSSGWAVLVALGIVCAAFALLFAYMTAVMIGSWWVVRRGQVVEVLAARLIVDDVVVPYADIEGVVGSGPDARVERTSGAPIPIGHIAGLPEVLRAAVDRFQVEQDGAEAETVDERARLQALSRTST